MASESPVGSETVSPVSLPDDYFSLEVPPLEPGVYPENDVSNRLAPIDSTLEAIEETIETARSLHDELLRDRWTGTCHGQFMESRLRRNLRYNKKDEHEWHLNEEVELRAACAELR